jgi:hypothetical protein
MIVSVHREADAEFLAAAVYYETGTRLRIVAVAHQSRKPGYWSGRT